jgi:hypothetical protein
MNTRKWMMISLVVCCVAFILGIASRRPVFAQSCTSCNYQVGNGIRYGPMVLGTCSYYRTCKTYRCGARVYSPGGGTLVCRSNYAIQDSQDCEYSWGVNPKECTCNGI